MNIARNVAQVLAEHVTLEVECIDRMYLNLYIPVLQTEGGVAYFWRKHRGHQFASSALMEPMTRRFVQNIESFAQSEGIDLISFDKGKRKEEVAKKYLRDFRAAEGVLFIGKAQEKAKVVRTGRRNNPRTGASYANLYKSTAIVNQYYFYCVDGEFGPFFIKFCSYFPYNGKLLINGHEYVKRQLDNRAIAYEPLDNGIAWCQDPEALQRICESLDATKIDRLLRKWLRRLPHPFTKQDRAAGFRYDISIIQSEFSLTQMLDRPLSGRSFFEQVIRDNLDLGRADGVQLIFERRISCYTPGRFRTRVITEGVIPSLYIDYRRSRIKQYFKEGRALRTETIVNDTYDFGIGRRLHNLASLAQVAYKANRRLLDVQRISHDCMIGEQSFSRINQPVEVDGKRASSLRFGNFRTIALFAAILWFRLLPCGFSNKELREQLAPLMGVTIENLSQGKMTYDLRRLRLHGIIEPIPKSHRYRVTDSGFRIATFFTRSYSCLLRPGLSAINDNNPPADTFLCKAFEQIDKAVEKIWNENRIAA